VEDLKLEVNICYTFIRDSKGQGQGIVR
jgi:hypothetical protein